MDARIGRRQKRISKRQEEQVASELGGRVQANSGATRLGGGSDVRVQGKIRVECKYTELGAFRLKLDELLKLKKEANRALEIPVFQFGFKGRIGMTYYAVIPWQEDYPTEFSVFPIHTDKKSKLIPSDILGWETRSEAKRVRMDFNGVRYEILPWLRFLESIGEL